MHIGELKLRNNTMAAPMAGYSDLPWRIIVTELGAGAVFSEMVSAEALRRAQKKTIKLILSDARARPFGIQLFGSKPESFKNAVSILLDIFTLSLPSPINGEVIRNYYFDFLDINMGCPAKKVISRGEGSALMKSPYTASQIIKAVRSVYGGPLTVKIRAGWDENSKNAVEIAKIAEDSGVDAVIVHPRTRTQAFKGEADWKVIADVKASVKIPVIGNGDVVDKASADRMSGETGCDGIMIGRAAIGNPWIFRELQGFPPPTLEEKFALMKRHFNLAMETKDERYAINVIRKFTPKYLKGIPGHKELVFKINTAKKASELLKYLEDFESFEHIHKNGD